MAFLKWGPAATGTSESVKAESVHFTRLATQLSYCLFLFLLHGAVPLEAQAIDGNTDGDESGRNIVAAAVTAMGGNALAGQGAATTTVTISGDGLTAYTATWYADWAGQAVRQRKRASRNAAVDEATEAATHKSIDGRFQMSHTILDLDLNNLVPDFPVVALSLALSQRTCVVERLSDPGRAVRDELGAVDVRCRFPGHPSLQYRALWWFGTDNIPSKVRIYWPSSGQNTMQYKLVEYGTFAQVQGALLPSSADITDGPRKRHYAFSAQSFSPSPSASETQNQ